MCEKYVWKCRDFSDTDFCNIHSPDDHFGYVAWELTPYHPKPIEYVEPEPEDLVPQPENPS